MSGQSQPAHTANVWAREMKIAENPIRQLLVPAQDFDIEHDAGTGRLWACGYGGRWPAQRGVKAAAAGELTALLPALSTKAARVSWSGSLELTSPESVTESYRGALNFHNPGEQGGLRRPQLGALHSVLGYWTTSLADPALVVMPTGTGKTETMVALMVAGQLRRVLVIVPSAALRRQIAEKFQTLGVLQQLGVIKHTALRPVVGRIEHGITDPAQALEFAEACNVVVATPSALGACTAQALEAFYPAFTHLMVDEAHHAPATTWARIISEFQSRPVMLLTATPQREDGRPIPGRVIYRFPLRAAQADGYFTAIDYRAVLSLESPDAAIADLALARLRRDLAADYDHILLARANSKARAKTLGELYSSKAPELGPRVLHDGLSARGRDAVFTALGDRSCRIVVCVDMLGEGFDLPPLKIAALHDVKKSLGPMVQFIGRFSRTSTSTKIGTASVFVARDPSLALSPLRDLLREDADWNLLLRDITERATDKIEAISAFEQSFTGTPAEVPVTLLEPKMSAIAHRSAGRTWDPEGALEIYDAGRLLDRRIATSADGKIAWFILEHHANVRWGDVDELRETTFELIVLYFDDDRRLLYIHGSANSGAYNDLAEAVLGECTPIKGLPTFRVLAGLDRLVPTNVGLLDARDHFNRFSMHVGSDVVEALNLADRHGKTQTHIAASGFDAGERTSVSAALSGRFWSMRTAENLAEWIDWCDEQGSKLLDESIDLNQVLGEFILPEDLTSRPPHILLGLEWPLAIVGGLTEGITVTHQGLTYKLLDIAFEVDDFGTTGPFLFSLVTPAWRVAYQAEFESTGLTYSPVAGDAVTLTKRRTIAFSAWLNQNKPTLFLDGDRMITPEDRLLAPRTQLPPFDRRKLRALDWQAAGVDIQVESQGAERLAHSIQAHTSAVLRAERRFDVLLDDDRAHEAADLVGLAIEDDGLHITLVHCKYSSGPTPGARSVDLYELCGQAMRGAKWRQRGALPLLGHLDRRARAFRDRTGVTPFEIGDIHELFRIRELAPQLRPRFHTILVQPGLSAAVASEEQLRLLAGAASYVTVVTKGTLEVVCSA